MILNPEEVFKEKGPSRKINHRGSSRVTGRFNSRRMRAMVPWESALEKEQLWRLEYDDDVSSFYAQPVKIEYELNGERKIYYPDMKKISIEGDIRFIEVKFNQEAQEEENKERFGVIEAALSELGFGFEVQTELDIRKGCRIDNLKKLFMYLHCSVPLASALKLRKLIDIHKTLTLDELIQRLGDYQFAKPLVYALLAQRALDLNVFEELRPESEIRLNPNCKTLWTKEEVIPWQ